MTLSYNGIRPRLGIIEGICLAATRLLDFRGRSRRSEFWPWMISVTLLENLLIAVLPRQIGFLPIFLLILFLRFAVTVRRLHDTGHSGTIVVVQIIAGILFHARHDITTVKGDELFDGRTMSLFLAIYAIIQAYTFVLALFDSQKDANRFDESPKYY